jgi:hypothetical protein
MVPEAPVPMKKIFIYLKPNTLEIAMQLFYYKLLNNPKKNIIAILR